MPKLAPLLTPKAPSVPCPDCHGRGGQDVMGNKPCNACMGSGRDLNVCVPFYAPCKVCNGRGKDVSIWFEVCKRCGGRGTLAY